MTAVKRLPVLHYGEVKYFRVLCEHWAFSWNFVNLYEGHSWGLIGHYENMPIQIYWKFYYQKYENYQIKTSDIFHISAQNIGEAVPTSTHSSKHRLRVLVGTASPRRFQRVPTIYVLSRNKKKNVYPYKPQFYYIIVGCKGGQNYIGIFRWCETSLSSQKPLQFGCFQIWNCVHCSQGSFL